MRTICGSWQVNRAMSGQAGGQAGRVHVSAAQVHASSTSAATRLLRAHCMPSAVPCPFAYPFSTPCCGRWCVVQCERSVVVATRHAGCSASASSPQTPPPRMFCVLLGRALRTPRARACSPPAHAHFTSERGVRIPTCAQPIRHEVCRCRCCAARCPRRSCRGQVVCVGRHSLPLLTCAHTRTHTRACTH